MPHDLVFDAQDTQLYVTSYGSDEVLRYDGISGAFIDAVVPTGSGGVDRPIGLTFGQDGNLYVSSSRGHEVLRYGALSQARFEVTLTYALTESVTVVVSTADDSTADNPAVAGSDYTPILPDPPLTLSFAPGDVGPRTILVETLDDGEEESDETFLAHLNLTDPTAARPGKMSGIGTIVDNDMPVTTTDHYAASQSTLAGTVVEGDLASTRSSDNNYEAIQEEETNGKPAKRKSVLEHQWTFQLAGVDPVMFFVEAFRSANEAGDGFEFSYSANGADYQPMLTVTKTADDNQTQSFPGLPTESRERFCSRPRTPSDARKHCSGYGLHRSHVHSERQRSRSIPPICNDHVW